MCLDDDIPSRSTLPTAVRAFTDDDRPFHVAAGHTLDLGGGRTRGLFMWCAHDPVRTMSRWSRT